MRKWLAGAVREVGYGPVMMAIGLVFMLSAATCDLIHKLLIR